MRVRCDLHSWPPPGRPAVSILQTAGPARRGNNTGYNKSVLKMTVNHLEIILINGQSMHVMYNNYYPMYGTRTIYLYWKY